MPAERPTKPRHAVDQPPRRSIPGLAWVRKRLPKLKQSPEPVTFRQHLVVFCKELLVVVLAALVVACLVRGFVGQMFLIPSQSMEPALVVKDRAIVEKISAVERGEVVVFTDPGGWIKTPPVPERSTVGQVFQFIGVLPDTSTDHLIKRVVGLPGDHVVCCDAQGWVTVNDQPLDETGYLAQPADETLNALAITPYDVVVPAGRLFVLGDNRALSADSRCHLNDTTADGQVTGASAFVPEELVVGQARAVLWPTSRIHKLGVPATFGTVPAGVAPAPDTALVQPGTGPLC